MKQLWIVLLTLTLTACSGCAGFTESQKIAASCDAAASALDTIVAAKVADKISTEQLVDAIDVYEAGVVPLCVPVPESLSGVQKAALAAVIAELTRRAGEEK